MFETYSIIEKLAKKRGIPLQKVATDIGLSENYIYKLKTKKTANIEPIEKIANYFHVSTDYLLGRTGTPTIASTSNETFSAKGRAIARKYDSSSPEKQKYYDKIIAAMFEDDEEDD